MKTTRYTFHASEKLFWIYRFQERSKPNFESQGFIRTETVEEL